VVDFSLTIGGVPKELRAGSLSIERSMNNRSTASFSIMSADQSYRPALNADVIIEVESERIFGGLITVPREKGLHGGVKRNIVTQVTAADYRVYPERRFMLEEIPAGTLKAALQVVLTYLTGYGVTLDGAQVNGPTLPALSYNYRRASDVLNELMSLTAQFGAQYVWEIDNFKVLRAYQPSTVPAPFDILADVDGKVQEVIGDIEYEKNLEQYANRIIVKVGPIAEIGRIETFPGDGATSTFTLNYTLTQGRGIIHVYELDGVTPAGGETFGIPPDAPLQWEYNPTNNTITRIIGPTDATKIYSLTFDGVLEQIGEAEDAGGIAALGLFERVILIEKIPEGATAQSLADGYLAQSLPIHHAIRYKTLLHGLAPGQSQAITVPARNLSGTMIVTSVQMREFGPARVIYDIDTTLEDDTNILKAYQDVYKLWRGDLMGTGASPGPTVGPGVPAIVGPAPPFRSNQFNNSGVFGGDAAWLFYLEYQTVTLGDNHTAAGLNNLLVGASHTIV
jgi:hypothetical protein